MTHDLSPSSSDGSARLRTRATVRSRRVVAVATLLLICAPASVSWSAGVRSALGISILGSARATAPAVRGARHVPPPPPPPIGSSQLDGCDVALLQRLIANDPTSAQWIMVVVPSSTATSGSLAIASVVDGGWRCSLSATVAQVGRAGTRPLLQRRSGDDTTPSGIFALGSVATPQGAVSFFGNSPDPGTLGPYRRIQAGDCYGANPNTPGYGHWRVDSATCTGDDELLQLNVQSYEHAVLIGANTEPNVSGDAQGEPAYAAAIFLHRTSVTAAGAARPTSGCVSIGHDELVTAMTTIDPTLLPRFAIGTRADLMSAT